MSALTIGKIARATGLGVETIRYYERERLIPAPGRSAAGYRLYGPEVVPRLRFVRRAKRLGFTLSEVRNLLTLADGDGDQAQVKRLTEQKLLSVRARIADLQRMEGVLADLAGRCRGQGCLRECPIIDALNHDQATDLEDAT